MVRSKFIAGVLVVSAVIAAFAAPSNALTVAKVLSTPKIVSAIGADELVTAKQATWSGPVKRKFQWLLNGKPIAKATTLKYRPTAAQLGKTLRFRETATFKTGKVLVSLSAPVVIGQIAFLADVSVMYRDEAQTTVEVYPPAVRPSTARLTYQWLRDGQPIPRAVLPTYTFGGSDQGALISVLVRADKAGYTMKQVESTAVNGPLVFDAPTELLWSDEFDGVAGALPDASKWGAQEGDGTAYGNSGWGNNERQWYLMDQARKDGLGNLVITATRTGADKYDCYYKGMCEWISSKLVTLNKVGVLYGRMSVRLRAAQGAGTWPAFWTLGANIGTIGWPRCGEIDVVELAGYAPTTVWGTPHGPATGGAGAGSTTELSAPAHSDFHVYTVDWYPDRMIWYLDGKPFHIYRKSEYPTDWVFNSEQYMILNLAMGGGFGGAINPALNEANIAVDWIRVYKVNGVGQVIIH